MQNSCWLQKGGKSLYRFFLKKQNIEITVRSNFDSGNLQKIQLNHQNNSIIFYPANDCSGFQSESLAKGWFYFSVTGFPIGSKHKFLIRKMNQIIGQLQQGKFSEHFRPVYRYGVDGAWQRVDNATVINREEDAQMHFQFGFEKYMETFFAFCYPYSYGQCQRFLREVRNQCKLLKNIYYHSDIIINSVESRPIHLLTITSHDRKLVGKQLLGDGRLFPSSGGSRASKFDQTKKIVVISARVHPGETPSSYVMSGVIKFLISKDARAELLRRNFVFKLIPMLNPDGVYHGHYRMDVLNQNLNRFYLNPDPEKQPSSYALKKLGEYYRDEKKLCFFLDLHAHPQKKGNFIYGNSIERLDQQIETQVFPKILAMNCVEFDYQNSCFSKNHMAFKDRNEDYSKEGCSRVVFHREMGVVYSYTLQCGYTASNSYNQLSPMSNPHRKVDKLGVSFNDIDNIKSVYYSPERKRYLSIRSYQNLGRCALISILDLFQLNQFSRLVSSNLKSVKEIRVFIGESLNKVAKQSRVYSNKIPSYTNTNIAIRKVDKINNETFPLGRTLPKPIIGPFIKKILTCNWMASRQKNREKDKMKTLPKMKGNSNNKE